MSTYTGIWIDSRNAKLVFLENNNEKMITIESNLDIGNVKGGSGSSTPYAEQDAVSESKILEKKKHQLHEYFTEIISKLGKTDELLIIGPAETKYGLQKEIEQDPILKGKLVMVQTVDSMTDNQIVARVKSFFRSTEV